MISTRIVLVWLLFLACAITGAFADCESIGRVDKCVGECSWQIWKTCDYRKSPVRCEVHEYGCRDAENFCAFTKGNGNARKQQCLGRGSPCAWNKKKKECSAYNRDPGNQNPGKKYIKHNPV